MGLWQASDDVQEVEQLAGEQAQGVRSGADTGKPPRGDISLDRAGADRDAAPFLSLGRSAVAGKPVKAARKLSGLPLAGNAAASPLDTSIRARPGQLHHRNISDGSVPVEGQHVELSPRDELRRTMRNVASTSGSGHTSRAGSRRPRDDCSERANLNACCVAPAWSLFEHRASSAVYAECWVESGFLASS